MKKLLLLVFALSLLPKGYAQDLLVTAKGDTVRCKIFGENGPTDFHIGPPARRDQNQFLRLQRHDPNHHTGLFCYRIVTGKGNAIAHCPANEPTRENKTLPRTGSGSPCREGYSHRLGKLASGLKSSYKTGFVIGGDLAGFFNEYIGLGGFVNYRQYNDGSVSSVVAGPKILSRFYNRTQNSAFILGVGLGYVSLPGERVIHKGHGRHFRNYSRNRIRDWAE